jgi:hypothetical protein
MFEISIANSYAQSNNITSEQEKSDNDVNSVLTVCSSQNSNLVLFDLNSDWESNAKKVEDILILTKGIYLPSPDQRFRRYGFLPDDEATENCNSGQIAASREKLNLTLFG